MLLPVNQENEIHEQVMAFNTNVDVPRETMSLITR